MGDVCMARIFCERTTLVLFGDDDDLSRSWRDEDGSSAMETGVKRDFVLVAVGRGGGGFRRGKRNTAPEVK